MRVTIRTCHIYIFLLNRFEKKKKPVNLYIDNIRQAIKRDRRKYRPKTSRSLEKLGNDLIDYIAVSDIYLGQVKSNDGGVALLFSTERLLQQLNEVDHIFMDGTFDVIHIPI